MNEATNPQAQRWTRDYVFDILRELGIHHIFGVPGTNEIPIIDGTEDPANGVRYIECLHENIAIGAAMGSARMTGKPGILVVHVTPGIAHSIGNLFNACRSRMPLVILCCQQQNDLVTQEPILASNLVDLARQYTKWAHEIRSPEEVGLVLQRAFKEAMAPPQGPVFLSIPWEFMMREIGPEDRIPGVTQIAPRFTGDLAAIEKAAALLAGAKNPLIVAGDGVGYAEAWPELQDLANLLGAPVVLQTFSSVTNFPNDDFHWQGELPGAQETMQSVFAEHDVAFLVGFAAQAQITVFKYSDGPLIPKDVRLVYLSNNTWDIGKNYYGECAILGDIKATLPHLNEQIRKSPPAAAAARNDELRALDVQRKSQWKDYLGQALQQPEIWAVVIADALREAIAEHELEKQFVYVHEAVSDPAPFQYLLPFGPEASAPVSYYCVAGGSLGWSLPASLGIKLESEGRQGITPRLVVAATGDGSSLFYPQVWWTAAHRQLAVLYIITNNHEYHTLQVGLGQVTAAYGEAPGYRWQPRNANPEYLRIQRPEVDFLGIARAFGGIPGEVVIKPGDVKEAVRRGVNHVLQNQQSYILDMRTAQATPAPPPLLSPQDAAQAPAPAAVDRYLARYAAQPPLDVTHNRGGANALAARAAPGPHGARRGHVNVRVIF